MDRLAGDGPGRGTATHASAVGDEGQDDSHHHDACQRFEIAMSQKGLESGGCFWDDDHWWGLQRGG